jgi:GTP cyclohydrolase I
MIDLQATRDVRDVELRAVGVSDIRLPIKVLDPELGQRDTVATVRMSVGLSAETRGTHLSRFLEVLNEYTGKLTLTELSALLRQLRERLHADSAKMEVDFDYFLLKSAPVSGVGGLIDYRCSFIGEDVAGTQDLRLRVAVPVTTVCPCSKAISRAGAHNQRTLVIVETRSEGIVWIEEIVAWVEASASCPVYPVLKRVDEKHVTETAYANPRFVEDVVREVMVRLRNDCRLLWARVEARSFESIHNHNAFAEAHWTRRMSPTPEVASEQANRRTEAVK